MTKLWTWEETFDWYDGPLCGIVSLGDRRFYAWVLDRPAGLPEALTLWPVEAFDHKLNEDELCEIIKNSTPLPNVVLDED